MSERPYDRLREKLREAEVLASVSGLLSWDQETVMPPAAAQLRAEQIGILSAEVHARHTAPELGDLLATCEADASLNSHPAIAANLRELRRSFDRATRIPPGLVTRTAETTTLAQHAWRDARERSDFAAFAPWLERVVGLSRERAECLADGGGAGLYDALMDEYEPGARAAEVAGVFDRLRAELAPLIASVADRTTRVPGRAQRGAVPMHLQAELNQRVARRIGFDFDAGRLDPSTHPFCQGVGPGDTRLTTRYDEGAFTDSLSSTLHEAGHGLYEQGLPKAEHPGQPLSEPASLGIHESQSRMWENQVGRSRAFWEWALPEARELFGTALEGVGVEEVFAEVNEIRPNLIRVDSDEATYNLHIMLRFDLERALLLGDLAVADLPGAWNERMRADLGMEVPDDRRGCLQDIHWAMGAIGYFPTYTLGNLYAAQLWAALRSERPALDEEIRAGEFAPILGWLRDRVHRHGRRHTADELCRIATGEPLRPEPFLGYLRGKVDEAYGTG